MYGYPGIGLGNLDPSSCETSGLVLNLTYLTTCRRFVLEIIINHNAEFIGGPTKVDLVGGGRMPTGLLRVLHSAP